MITTLAEECAEGTGLHSCGLHTDHRAGYVQQISPTGFASLVFSAALKDRGFIGPETLEFFEGQNGINMAQKAKPTEIGRIYITLRKADVPKEWLSTDPDKRKNLKVDVARDLGLTVPEPG
jgi:hypothetical protein